MKEVGNRKSKKKSKDGQKNKLPTSPFGANFFFIWILAIGLLLASDYIFNPTQVVSYNEILKSINEGKIKKVTISKDQIVAELQEKDQKKLVSYTIEDKELIPLLKSKGIEIQGTPDSSFWSTFFIWVFPLLLIFFLFRTMMGGMKNPLFSMNKSKAKIYMEKDIKVSFEDVAGAPEAKAELQEIVNFLKSPGKYSRLGGRMPKGILLVGPPGTGKTLIAKAVAGEANVPFFSINGSEFVELFVGMGASRVRDLFEQARQKSPCIIFIDELDALGKARNMGPVSGSNDEKEQTLNQLLAELDGFDSGTGVVLLAATNRPEILDPALLRAGRFDRQVLMDNPDRLGREQILEIHSKKVKIAKDLDLKKIASLTAGFSGADLANLVNEATLTATRRNAESIEESDFVKALERIVAGLERKQRIMNPEEKKRVALHEMGHTTVALATHSENVVQKVSIIPRGIGALGYTLQRPVEDRYLVTRKELYDKIAVLLGGRVAEEVYCDDFSTGAGDDLVKATNIARAMVTEYGMGESLGVMSEGRGQSQFLNTPQGAYEMPSHLSEDTKLAIDNEVKSILEKSKKMAEDFIRANSGFFKKASDELLEKETLEGHEIEKLWRQEHLAQ